MPPKKVFSTPEEEAEYLEELKRKNRERVKAFYENKIKTNPEKYEQFLNKCKKHNNVYYHTHKNLTVAI